MMNGVSPRLRFGPFAVLSLILAFSPPASSVAQGVAAPVVPVTAGTKMVKRINVVFTGARSLDEARVRSQMSLREGELYSDEKVEQDIKRLFATGVEDVSIRAEDVAGGVNVIVTVKGRGAVGSISFLGNSVVDEARLRKEIEVKPGDPVDEVKLTAAVQKIREVYEKRGYSDVLVNYITQPAATDGFVAVTFNVEEGARGVINDIRFEGNTAIKAGKLRDSLKSKKKSFWRLWGKSFKLNDENLKADIEAVETAFQDEGYLYAKVTEVRREPVGTDRIDLVFVIVEGEKFDVAEVALDGVTVFSQDELAPGIVTEAGFPYSVTQVKADEKMIMDYYGSRGYDDARVETSVLAGAPGQVKILYRVTEGSKSYIQKVNIAGNAVTQDRVIRRELPFAPGEEVNTVKIEAGRNRLKNMNYFSEVDVRRIETAPGFKDVEVYVKEQSTGTINFGAGFSSIDSLVGFVDLTQTNFDITDWPSFRGAGQRFNLNARFGLERRDFNMSLTEPWFLGQKLSLTTSIFYRNLFFLSDRFDQTEAGGSVGLRKPLGEHAYFDTTYTLQNVTIDDIDETSSEIIKAEEGDYLQSKVDFTFVHDTRDNLFITRKGHKVELGLMTSGSFLGGDVDAYGLNFQGAQYISLPGDTILSFEGALRTVDGWGDGDGVPIFERLFLGGANNLRGFDFREVGPKDETGEPIGGGTSAYLTTEFTFPIFEKVRGAVFYDVGFVNLDAYDLSTADLNSNVGVGLRLFLPIGPVRVDFGVPTKADEWNDSGGRFQFNVGYKF
jgi:outer membrane protein insertion porin family